MNSFPVNHGLIHDIWGNNFFARLKRMGHRQHPLEQIFVEFKAQGVISVHSMVRQYPTGELKKVRKRSLTTRFGPSWSFWPSYWACSDLLRSVPARVNWCRAVSCGVSARDSMKNREWKCRCRMRTCQRRTAMPYTLLWVGFVLSD